MLVKSFVVLVEKAECIKIGIKKGDLDAVIKKMTKLTHNIIAKANFSKDTKNNNTIAANKAVNVKKQRPDWSYDHKFTHLKQSLGEIMKVLLQKGTLILP